MAGLIDPTTASADVDLGALQANVAALRRHVGSAEVMVVVKADGYGHGMVPCARAARAAGATWLGVATPDHPWVGVALPGPAWTAQAGSGDVLGGVCGTLLAAGLPAWQAGLLGASVQAYTARTHPGPLPPHDLARRLPASIGRLEARARALGGRPARPPG